MPKIRMSMKDVPASWRAKRMDEKGYPIVWYNGHWMGRHRVRAEKAMGRRLKKGEVVHHVNGDKEDYRNCNLLVCTAQYHRELHLRCLERYGTWHLPRKAA